MVNVRRLTWALFALFSLVVCQSSRCSETYDEQLSRRLMLHSASTFCADGDAMNAYSEQFLTGFIVDTALRHEQTASRVVIGHGDGYAVIAARGTPLNDALAWLLDADLLLVDYPQNTTGYEHVRVHKGFLSCWEALAGDAVEALNRSIALAGAGSPQVLVTGHSLGAAVATLASLDIQRQLGVDVHLYTYGSPRVGNRAFATMVDEQLSGRAFRVVHNHDVVPHLPRTFPCSGFVLTAY
jgi:predicted lipase